MTRKRATSAEKGLLANIVEQPEDDAPRLVYADWLDEHGDSERAEFIRAQVEQARLQPGDPRGADLVKRAEVLLEAHGARWLKDLPAGIDRGWFRRGFLARVAATVPQFLREGAAWRRAPPSKGWSCWMPPACCPTSPRRPCWPACAG